MSPKFLVISSLVKFISSTKEANLQTVFLPTEGSPARTRWPRSVAKTQNEDSVDLGNHNNGLLEKYHVQFDSSDISL